MDQLPQAKEFHHVRELSKDFDIIELLKAAVAEEDFSDKADTTNYVPNPTIQGGEASPQEVQSPPTTNINGKRSRNDAWKERKKRNQKESALHSPTLYINSM
ncbi:hypothetical protein H0H92_005565 [Tricholoma furcatifolium]|nr:hypothetical protein H0H92_005565 [Tricholoma furcatifolium]